MEFDTAVDLLCGETELRGLATRDLSHSGVFIPGSHGLEPGQECRVKVRLGGAAAAGGAELLLEGRVARVDSSGVAMRFLAMDAETYRHLRNLVMLNSPDPEATAREFTTPAFEPDEDKKP